MRFAFPWDDEPAPVAPPVVSDGAEQPPPRRGRRPAAVSRSAAWGRTSPAWLYHHLTISGPADTVAAFAVTARGAGVIPWRLDGARLEEDVFHLAVSQPAGQRTLTIEGCRILARQFRERAEAGQARVAAQAREGSAWVGRSQACPFDLQTMLPVPATLLQLGPNHPAAQAWLAAHWGTTDRLRQVVARSQPRAGRRLPKTHTVIGYGFFTAGDTPQTAITKLSDCWPALRFCLQPRPAD